jgi:hypothetical protein
MIRRVGPEVAALLPEALAREAGVVPLDDSDGVITLAAGRPLSDEMEDTLRFVLNRAIRVVIQPEEAIQAAISAVYGEPSEMEVSLFYYRETAHAVPDGAIGISVSGWESGQGRTTHWTGWDTIGPEHPDYRLWGWIVSQGDRFPEIIGPSELDAIRDEFRRGA